MAENIDTKIYVALFFLGIVILISSCRKNENMSYTEVLKVAEITKWQNDYRSAFSPTHDTGRPDLQETENNWLIENGLFMDYEIVSYNFDRYPSMYRYLRDNLVPHGFGTFGHGHKHDNHDNFGYEYSLDSFTQNYQSMVNQGFHPVSYAYPHGGGRLPETRQALKEAGFLSGRLFEPEFEEYGPYITPGDEMEPPYWLSLPSLRMEDLGFQNRSDAVNNAQELIEHLDTNIELGAWLISTYHNIGWDGETDGRTVGWGYYKRENFYEEMLYVKEKREEGKIWLASMDDVTLYMMQRNNASYNLEQVGEKSYELMLDDGLDNELFRMDLTLRFTVDPAFINKKLVISSENQKIDEIEIDSDEILVNLHPSGVSYYITLE